MRTVTRQWFGDYRVDEHTFAEAGDELRVHAHTTAEKNHLTIVVSGELACLGKRDGQILRAGDRIAWEIGESHGFRALTPAVVLNIRYRSQFPVSEPAPTPAASGQ